MPFQLVTYVVVVVWYALHGHTPATIAARQALCPWYTTKAEPAYEDMLTQLRLALTEARFSGFHKGRSAQPEKVATPDPSISEAIAGVA